MILFGLVHHGNGYPGIFGPTSSADTVHIIFIDQRYIEIDHMGNVYVANGSQLSKYNSEGKQVCNFSDSFIFDTRCDVQIHSLEKSISEVKIFPNPFNEKIFVTFTLNKHQRVDFEVISSTGKTIFPPSGFWV